MLPRAPTVQSRLRLEQKGMDIPHLSRAEILHTMAAFPPPAEQRAINERNAALDRHIEPLRAREKAIEAAQRELSAASQRLAEQTTNRILQA